MPALHRFFSQDGISDTIPFFLVMTYIYIYTHTHRIDFVFDKLGLDTPDPPEPLYSFFPIYSPFKLNDDDGFDLGEDNKIQTIYVQDNALRFELSAVLRPGRFLGNHYLAFSLPRRTFIITMDRVREGIKEARKNKRAARELRKVAEERRVRELSFGISEPAVRGSTRKTKNEEESLPIPPVKRTRIKSFFSRFVDGYLQAEREDANSNKVTTSIRDFFGRQGGSPSVRRTAEV